MKKELSRISRYRIQFAATILGCISLISIVKMDTTYVIEFVYYIALIVGSGLLTAYYKKRKKSFLAQAHIILLIGFVFRFCDIGGQCLFGGDVPCYSILLFGFLPGASILAEVGILTGMKSKISDSWRNIILINSFIQILFRGLMISWGIVEVIAGSQIMSEMLSGLYVVTLLITNMNIGFDCLIGETDYLGENRVHS